MNQKSHKIGLTLIKWNLYSIQNFILFFFRFSKQSNITLYFTEDRTTENQTKPQFSLRSNFHRERERERERERLPVKAKKRA